jgi:hypothetical protein
MATVELTSVSSDTLSGGGCSARRHCTRPGPDMHSWLQLWLHCRLVVMLSVFLLEALIGAVLVRHCAHSTETNMHITSVAFLSA